MLKPMNCPHHIKIFASQKHSYRDLPIRLAEFGTVYRWEQSGELGGMTRVRSFTQDDAHLFCTEEQMPGEIMGCLGLVKTVFQTLGMKDYRVRVGLRDPDSAKYTGDPANWDKPAAKPPPVSASPFPRNRAKPRSTGPRSISSSRTSWAANGSSAPSRSTTTCPSASTSPTRAPTARNTARS
jgi:threonyl-tRNA synthetase